MKILFPFVGDSVGGSHISTLELYSSLISANISVIIVLHEDGGPLSQYLRNKGVPFFILKSSRLAGESPGKLSIVAGILNNFFCFGRFIKAHKIDIVHGNDLRINLSWSLPARIFSKGFIWHQRTLLSASKLWCLIRYLCDYFVAISDVVMQSTPQNICKYKKKVIYNPFNIHSPENKDSERERIIGKYNLPEDCFLIGCIGRIVNYKNIDFVINNIPSISKGVNKKIYLIIAGTGSKMYIDELRERTCDLGINESVIFYGFTNNPNKILASLDLLVAPSIIDAFGRTIVEAMLQKTPVLAAKSGGHIGIISDGINGTFYKPNISCDFIEKISAIVSCEPASVLTCNAYQFAKYNFSSKQHLTNILLVYHNLFKS
jgi:glycosyltransferase involved in cell wall biosynthesis